MKLFVLILISFNKFPLLRAKGYDPTMTVDEIMENDREHYEALEALMKEHEIIEKALEKIEKKTEILGLEIDMDLFAAQLELEMEDEDEEEIQVEKD